MSEKRDKNKKYKDSDKDGLSDYDEKYIYGSDPHDPDTDGDGVDDGDAVLNGRHPVTGEKLKDFFISHKGNNYHPHIFNFKRLTFYTVSAVLIKVILIAAAVLLPARAWLSPDILIQESKKVIQLTNQFRQEKGVDTLEASDKLNEAAFLKCQDMLIKQYFSHVSPTNKSITSWISQVNYSYVTAGENLAMGFSEASELVQAWKNSESHRQNLLDPDYSEIGVAMSNGEYKDSDTTLAAQYFAQPFINKQPDNVVKEGSEEQDEQEVLPDPEVQDAEEQESGELQAELSPNDSDSQVLAEKQDSQDNISEEPVLEEITSEPEIELEKPSLEILSNKNSSNTEVEISFSAPKAERVEIYSQEEVIKELEGPFEKSQLSSLSLEEGSHSLYIKSFYQDQVKSSEYELVNIDTTPPQIDQENTYVEVNEVNNESQLVIQAVAHLSSDTIQARLSLKDNHNINLNKEEDGTWRGSTIIDSSKEEFFRPVILANLEIQDEVGNSLSQTVNWKDVKPVTTSSLDQYFYLKAHPSPVLSSVFSIGSIYYIALLSLALLVLGINIVLNIKRQKKHVILSVLGFSIILSFLIWF